MVNTLGRKGVLQLVGPAFFIAWGSVAYFSHPVVLIIGRTLAGFGCGCAAIGATYLTEIAKPAQRGFFGSCFQFFLCLGMFLIYVIALFDFAQLNEASASFSSADASFSASADTSSGTSADRVTYVNWRMLAAIIAGFAAAFTILLQFIPESPVYFERKGCPDKAVAVSRRLHPRSSDCMRSSGGASRGEVQIVSDVDVAIRDNHKSENDDSDVEDGAERGQLLSNHEADENQNSSIDDSTNDSIFCRQVLLGFLVLAFQQFTGINALCFYLNNIFESAGVTNSNLASCGVMLAQMLCTLVSATIVDAVGRKTLLFWSGIGVVLCQTAFVLCYMFEITGLVVVAIAVLFMVVFSIGWGPIAALYCNEVVPNRLKARALPICFALGQKTCAFLVTQSVFYPNSNTEVTHKSHEFGVLVFLMVNNQNASFNLKS